MKRSWLTVVVFGALVASLGVMGCSAGGADLEGKKWLLASYGDPDSPQAVITDTRVTAEFSEGEVAGTAGCNRYFGSYEAKGKSLTFGPVASTEMWCADPEGVMDQEYAYLQALGKAEQYEVKDGKLIITCTDDQVLTFAEEFGAELESKTWVLKSYGDADNPTAVIAGTEVTAEFAAGQVNGSAGCNRYFGSYEAGRESMAFGPMGSTMMECAEPEGRMDQEYAYLQGLGEAKQYEVKDGKLIITCTDDQVLTFAEKFGVELEGKTWVLKSYGDADNPTAVITGTEVTAEFAAGQVNGSAGCNRYFGSYEAGRESIAFGPMGSTRMACAEPEGIMDQEYAYLQALGKAELYEVKDGKLIITCTDDQVLTFTGE